MQIVDNFMTLENYAAACGVTTRTIHARIRHHRVAYLKIGKQVLIDINETPPSSFINPHDEKIPLHVSLPPGVNIFSLVAIKDYIYKNNLRGHYLFELAMLNKIESFLIGGVAFAYKSELDAVPKPSKRPKY